VTAERIPVRYRRASIVLVPLTILAAVWLARYPAGGGRLAQEEFGFAAPVTVGEEFHVGVALRSTGGTLGLIDIRPVGVSGPVIVDVHVGRRAWPGGFGSVRGPLTASDGIVVLPTAAG